MKYASRGPGMSGKIGTSLVWTDHRLIVEYQAITCAEGGGGGGEVCIDEKCLASHFWCFGGYDIDKFSIGSKEGIELRANFILVYLVIEIVDIKGCVGLNACDIGHDQWRGGSEAHV